MQPVPHLVEERERVIEREQRRLTLRTLGEVVVVGQSNWGGTVELLVIVRPFFHDGLTTDPYAESLVNAWIDA